VVDLSIGESGSITFGDPGSIHYECPINPQQMHGQIIVKEG
jgi:plastocyanin